MSELLHFQVCPVPELLQEFLLGDFTGDALARVAVLAASVGTQVTTVARIFCARPELANDVFQLLPTFLLHFVSAVGVPLVGRRFTTPGDGLRTFLLERRRVIAA